MKKIALLFLIFYYQFINILFAQQSYSDSLIAVINSKQHDTVIASALNELGVYYINSNPDTSIIIINKALKLSENCIINNKKGWLNGIAVSNGNTGIAYFYKGNYDKTIEHYFKAFDAFKKMNSKTKMAGCYNNIGRVYSVKSDYNNALNNFYKALKLYEETNDKRGITAIYANLGILYHDLNDHEKALEYYFKALQFNRELGRKKGESTNLANIGLVYSEQKKYEKALEYYFKALEISYTDNDKDALVTQLGNIGNCYHILKEYNKALDYYLKALKISEELENKNSIAINYRYLGALYIDLKKYNEAEKYLIKSLKLSEEINIPYLLKEQYLNLSDLYAKTNREKLALDYYKKHISLRDSLISDENTKELMQKELQHNFDKKAAADSLTNAKEREIKNAEIAKQQAEIKAKKNQQYALFGGLALVLIFAGIMYNRFKITQKQKEIIEIQKDEVHKQKELVEEKHKEITDSINYAERIQRSFLASEDILNKYLIEYFVFFKPKDVVSGDFYWADTLSNGNFILATADSTGHGVPGAIMSLLNITSLDKAIERTTNPAEILNYTRNSIINRLKKDGSAEGGKDGMDCSLIVFDFKQNKLHIAAANNPVWIIREKEIIEIKPDKMPVGKHDKDTEPFTLHTIKMVKGDCIYTLTDGFPDQFGGPKGKKFMSKNLKEFLINNANIQMAEQKINLEQTFTNWVGNFEQIDDVCVIGIRV